MANATSATTAGTVTTAAQPNITSVGTLTSLTSTGNISTTGNISGAYLFGNASQLTGLPEVYGNANVVTLLANFGSNSISTSGNITATHLTSTGNMTVQGNLFSDDITSTGVTVYGDQIITGNLTVQGNTTTINSNTITTNDKVITVANNQSTGANVDGSGLDAGNPAIATWLYNDLTTSWQSNIGITPKANATQSLGGPVNQWSTVYGVAGEFAGNVTVANLQTGGSVSAVGNVSGAYLFGNGSQLTGLPEVYGNANVTTLLANFGSNSISTTGNVTAGYVIGNGSALTNITGANVTGSVAQANIANTANSVAGANVSGQVANALIAGTVYIAAQPAITSVGTLISLTSSGNISTTGNVTDK